MWRETEEPRERWRGQAPAEGDEETAGTRVRPALSSSPSPHLFETICNHQSRILCVPKVRQLEWGTHTCSPNGSV